MNTGIQICDTAYDVVSVVSGGESGGQESRTLYGRISILNQDPLDHRYQTA